MLSLSARGLWVLVLSTVLFGCRGPVLVQSCVDADGDGWSGVPCGQDQLDCDDSTPDVAPGAEERLNGIDDDCDGEIDEGIVLPVRYLDADGDGFGGQLLVGPSDGAVGVEVGGDCDDTRASVFPGAPEVCNDRDDDCDVASDEGLELIRWYPDRDGDGAGASAGPVVRACAPVSGHVADGSDCDDAAAEVHPGAVELCNQRDDDCDGLTDDGVTARDWYPDGDGDGFGSATATPVRGCEAARGAVTDHSDCDDAAATVHPGSTERCNQRDDDCDGQTDEQLTCTSTPTGWVPVTIPSRMFHAAAFDSARGELVVFGGLHDGAFLSDTWTRRGGTWTFHSPAHAPSPRTRQAMAFDASRGRVVLFGGRTEQGNRLGDTWEWDGTDWTERTASPTPSPREGALITYDSTRQRVLLFGGASSSVQADTWVWDGSNWIQLYPTQAPPPRYLAHGLTFDSQRGVAVLFGGWGANGSLADTWEWNGTTWSQSNPARVPSTRYLHTLAYDPTRQRVVLFGGDHQGMRLGDGWEWDGTNWSPLLAGANPDGRGAHTLVLDSARQRLVLFGGDDTGTTRFDDTWELAPSGWARTSDVNPSPRFFQGLTFDSARGRSVLFGGQGLLGNTNDTWEWDGAVWIQRTPAVSPDARHAALTFDSARGVTVLFGGSGRGDTWEWDGTAWKERVLLANTPPGRSGHAVAYDSTRHVVMVFGGIVNQALANDLWVFDGTRWTQKQSSVSPPARQLHTMAYDSARDRVVLFGGLSTLSFNGPVLGDTWEWDGSQWVERQVTTGPVARAAHGATFDSTRGVVVLSQGKVGTMTLGDTWEWNGTQWTELVDPVSPTPRQGHSMTYDSTSQRVLLFGGNVQSDLWERQP